MCPQACTQKLACRADVKEGDDDLPYCVFLVGRYSASLHTYSDRNLTEKLACRLDLQEVRQDRCAAGGQCQDLRHPLLRALLLPRAEGLRGHAEAAQADPDCECHQSHRCRKHHQPLCCESSSQLASHSFSPAFHTLSSGLTLAA